MLALLPSVALIVRLAGFGRSRLPSPVILVLLMALAYVVASRSRALFRRHASAFALAAIIALSLVVRLPGIGADLGHTPLDIDENRLAASVEHFFDTGGIDHRLGILALWSV